jgi:hypothetical protein
MYKYVYLTQLGCKNAASTWVYKYKSGWDSADCCSHSWEHVNFWTSEDAKYFLWILQCLFASYNCLLRYLLRILPMLSKCKFERWGLLCWSLYFCYFSLKGFFKRVKLFSQPVNKRRPIHNTCSSVTLKMSWIRLLCLTTRS